MKEKSLAKNAILNTIKTLMSLIFPLITYPYVTRVLQVNNLGKVNFSSSIVSYFTLLAGLGINTYAIREGSRIRQDKQKIENFSAQVFTINVLSTILAYGLFLLTILMTKSLHSYVPLILIQSIGIIGPSLGVEWLYSVYEDYGYITIRSIVVQIASMVLLFLFVHKQSDYIIYAAILVFSSTAAYLFNFIHSKKYIKLKLIRQINLKKHIKPIMIIFAMSVATTIYVNSDTTMLGFLSGDHYVGLYNASTKIYTVFKSLMAACILVSLPRLSNYLALNRINDFNEKASDIFNVFLTFLLPTIVGTFMTAQEIIVIIAGKSFVNATPALKILSISLFFSIIAVYFTNVVLLPLKEEKQIMYATLASAIINFGLNFIFIPRWNHVGAALTTLIAEVVIMSWQLIAYKKGNHNIMIKVNKSNLRAVLFGCIAVILVCVGIDSIHFNLIFGFIIKVILSIIIYIVILLIFHSTIIINALDVIKGYVKKR